MAINLTTSRLPILENIPPQVFKISFSKKISFLIARILQIILPKTWFCWISRSTIQLQSIFRPRRWSYWTKLSDNILLGAIPLKNWNHLDKLTKCGVRAVLSINEAHEFQSQCCANPIKAADWKKRDINFLNISSPDLQPINVLKLAKAVDYVATQVNLGNRVYIHCVGGRGRSVSVAICSLIRINSFTLEESFNHVKALRSQYNLNQQQICSIVTWYKGEGIRKSALQI